MRVAGIDIGTNTVRLLVADVLDGAIIDVARRSEVVGLGRGLETYGIIAQEALELASQTLGEYSVILDVTRPDHLRVVATAASRQAANSEELVSIVYEAVVAKPEIIRGDV